MAQNVRYYRTSAWVEVPITPASCLLTKEIIKCLRKHGNKIRPVLSLHAFSAPSKFGNFCNGLLINCFVFYLGVGWGAHFGDPGGWGDRDSGLGDPGWADSGLGICGLEEETDV